MKTLILNNLYLMKTNQLPVEMKRNSNNTYNFAVNRMFLHFSEDLTGALMDHFFCCPVLYIKKKKEIKLRPVYTVIREKKLINLALFLKQIISQP